MKKRLPAVKARDIRLNAKAPQVRNAGILNQVKAAVVKENYLDTLRAIDPELVKTAVSGPRFQECFFENGQNKEIEVFVREILE
ncbi:Putative sugar phosphate isomerase [Salmonella enterica subsp. arizonae]|nr:Putative sugar phosphate isomerase [Salmonella enterica subsp. arizonae]